MQMLLTTTGFFLLTAVMVARHLRRRTPVSGPAAPCRSSGPACPRCKSALPVSATFCPGCGTPQQLYEVTRIKAVPENAGTALSQGKPHAVVLAEKCVGCATCVASCPIPGAIRMEQKLAVVDLSVCQGIADCAAACPMGAIVVTTGDAVQRLEVPEVHTDFQTNVPGLYIAGELGGRGLIKNAINEGKLAVENIAQALPPGEKRSDGVAEALDLAIVGGGPAGISAALEAHRIGLSYVVLEQGSLADTIRKYPRRKLLLAEPVKIPLYGDLWVADSSKETLLQVWDSIIENTHLRVKTGHRVEKIVRDGPFFHLEAAGTPFKARCLLLAIGRRGTPRRLGIPGEDLDKVFYDVVEMEEFAGRRILVVGGGDSAVESALGLSNQEKTEVLLSYRGETLSRVKDRNKQKFETAVKAGLIKPLYGSRLEEIRDDAVVLNTGRESLIQPNDNVIIRIGGEPASQFLQNIGVRIVQKDIPFAPTDAAG